MTQNFNVFFLCQATTKHNKARRVSIFCNTVMSHDDNICTYRQVSNIRRTWVGHEIVDHSDVVGAPPVGAAPTTSSFSTEHLASIYCAKTTASRVEKHLSFSIWCDLYERFYGTLKSDKVNLNSKEFKTSYHKYRHILLRCLKYANTMRISINIISVVFFFYRKQQWFPKTKHSEPLVNSSRMYINFSVA